MNYLYQNMNACEETPYPSARVNKQDGWRYDREGVLDAQEEEWNRNNTGDATGKSKDNAKRATGTGKDRGSEKGKGNTDKRGVNEGNYRGTKRPFFEMSGTCHCCDKVDLAESTRATCWVANIGIRCNEHIVDIWDCDTNELLFKTSSPLNEVDVVTMLADRWKVLPIRVNLQKVQEHRYWCRCAPRDELWVGTLKRCIPNLDLGSIRLDDRSLVSSIELRSIGF